MKKKCFNWGAGDGHEGPVRFWYDDVLLFLSEGKNNRRGNGRQRQKKVRRDKMGRGRWDKLQ